MPQYYPSVEGFSIANQVWANQPGKYFCLSSRPKGKPKGTGLRDHWFEKFQFHLVAKKVMRLRDDRHVWFCPHGFNDKFRQAIHAAPSNFIYADCDAVNPRDAKLQPSVVIESSPGRYVGLWYVGGGMDWERDNREWTKLHKYDPGGWDPTQVLRMIGSFNHKYDPAPRVKLIGENATNYELSNLQKLLPKQKTKASSAVVNDMVALFDKWEKRFPDWLRAKIQSNQPDPNDKSGACINIARGLLECGVSGDDTGAFVRANINFVEKYGARKDVDKQFDAIMREAKAKGFNGSGGGSVEAFKVGRGITAAQLEKKVYRPIKWTVPDYIPEGLTLLGGPPKIGKSWLVLDIGLAVATGGYALNEIQCPQGDVLYLALEDGLRRLKRRMRKLQKSDWPANLTFHTEWPLIGQGAEEAIEDWLKATGNPKLVVLDNLTTLKPRVAKASQQSDYDAVAPLQKLVKRFPGVSMICVAHTRKGLNDENPMDEIAGTNGLGAGVDLPTVMRYRNGQVLWYGRGRDAEGFHKVIKFEDFRWSVVGDHGEVLTASNPEKIRLFLRDAPSPRTPTEISRATEIDLKVVNTTLSRMLDDGHVVKTGRGLYKVNKHNTKYNTNDNKIRVGVVS